MEKSKGFIAEFKEFISRGNVVDLAVGVIIGSTFTAIVTSLVNDIIMPIVGLIFGGIDFSSLRFVIRPATENMAEAALTYGNFIQALINFLLIALVVFLLVKGINSLHKKKEDEDAPAAEPSEEVILLTQIRDSLQK